MTRNDLDFDDDEVELLACPSCGARVYEETEKCPRCGDWITPIAAHARQPSWVRLVALLLLFMLAGAILGGLLRWF